MLEYVPKVGLERTTDSDEPPSTGVPVAPCTDAQCVNAREILLSGSSLPDRVPEPWHGFTSLAWPKFGGVYVVACTERVKVGRAQSIRDRLRGLQCAAPLPLHLIAFLGGDGSAESQIHRDLARYRAHGEWFDFSREVARYVIGLMLDRTSTGRRILHTASAKRFIATYGHDALPNEGDLDAIELSVGLA